MEKMEETALNSSNNTNTNSNTNTNTNTKDSEAQTLPKPKSKHRRRNICLAVTASVIILFVLVVVILAFTVFKAKEPRTTIDSIKIDDLKVALDPAGRGVDLNLTLDIDLTIKNRNKVGFKYRNGSAVLTYRGEVVGEVPISAGKMGAEKTRPMNITAKVMADRLLSNSQLYSDVLSGVLTMSSVIKLSGKALIFNIFKVGVDTTTNCDFTVFISNISIADQDCKSKAKL